MKGVSVREALPVWLSKATVDERSIVAVLFSIESGHNGSSTESSALAGCSDGIMITASTVTVALKSEDASVLSTTTAAEELETE